MKDNEWTMRYYDYHSHYEYYMNLEAVKDLAPEGDERILDLGCGDGKLSEFIQSYYGATVLGIDSNADCVTVARKFGVNAHVENAQNIQFDREFDAVFSNCALHCILRQQDVIMRVFNALKPGGRFVAAMGGVNNAINIRLAVAEILAERNIDFFEREPHIYPTSDEQRERLRRAEFDVIKCSLSEGSSPMPARIVRDWFDACWRFDEILSDLSASDRNEVISSIVERLSSKFCNTNGELEIDWSQLNFVAVKPGCSPIKD